MYFERFSAHNASVDIYLHSYTFRAHPFETAAQYARRFGYDGIELSLVHCRDTQLRDDLARCIGVANRYGLPIGCVDFRGNFIDDSEKNVYDSVALMEKNIAICSEQDIRLMNGFVGFLAKDGAPFRENGSAIATDAHYDRAADSLRYLGDIAEKNDVRLTLEIHMNTPHDTVASTKRMLGMLNHPRIAANPDPGNQFAVCGDQENADSLDIISDHIGYFHFKNCAQRGEILDYSVSLAEGHIDTFAYLAKLRDLGYAAPVCIEYVGEGDPRHAAKFDVAYLRECLQLLDDGLS